MVCSCHRVAKRLAAIVFVSLIVLAFATAGEAAGTGSLTMGPQAMEGNLIVAPGTVIEAGYDLTIPGSHPGDLGHVCCSAGRILRQLHFRSRTRHVHGLDAEPSRTRAARTMATGSRAATSKTRSSTRARSRCPISAAEARSASPRAEPSQRRFRPMSPSRVTEFTSAGTTAPTAPRAPGAEPLTSNPRTSTPSDAASAAPHGHCVGRCRQPTRQTLASQPLFAGLLSAADRLACNDPTRAKRMTAAARM